MGHVNGMRKRQRAEAKRKENREYRRGRPTSEQNPNERRSTNPKTPTSRASIMATTTTTAATILAAPDEAVTSYLTPSGAPTLDAPVNNPQSWPEDHRRIPPYRRPVRNPAWDRVGGQDADAIPRGRC
jgi:hypothetical protein